MNLALIFLVINLIFFGAVAIYFINLKREVKEEKEHVFEERKFDEERIVRAEEELKDELDEVRKRAHSILTESEKIAKDLIYELENSLGVEGKHPNIKLPDGNNFEIELGNLSQKIKGQYVSRIQSLLRSFEKFQVQEAKKVEEFAEEQKVSTDKNIQQIRVEALDRMHKRIERYKEEEIALFDEKVRAVIDEAALEVLGHALTQTEHEELITKALIKARDKHTV